MTNRKPKVLDRISECCTHDHGHGDAVAKAEAICAAQGLKLTPQRRKVLELLAASSRPLGAYELLDRMADHLGRRPAPVTVYRALDFLLAHGLAHRIESRNAFIACSHVHRAKDLVLFMICDACGCVSEAQGSLLIPQLDAVAAQTGFKPGSRVIEIFGRCSHCP